MAKFELYGTASCLYTQEMREWLEFQGHEFVAGAGRTVPVLVEDGKVTQVGWQGRGCVVSLE